MEHQSSNSGCLLSGLYHGLRSKMTTYHSPDMKLNSGNRYFSGLTWLCILFLAGLFLIGCATAAPGWKFHADNQNTGVYDGGGIIPTNTTKWTFTTGNTVQSSPAVVDGVVYVGSKDQKLYAVNAETGAKIWEFATGHNVWSSPAVVNGIVYFGSWDSYLYAVYASNGTQKWKFLTGDPILSSPAVADGTVYVGSYDNKMYAVNADTGTKKWEFTSGGDVGTSPAVANGMVYFGSWDNKLHAVRVGDGVEVWNYTTWDDVRSSPAVADGVVYFGSDDHSLYALNAMDGSKLWNYPTSSEIFSSPAVANGLVYVGSDDYNLYAIYTNNGTKCWSFSPSSHYFYSSPAIADGVVYAGSFNARLYAVDALTGVERWNYLVGGTSIYSTPAISNGVVYIGGMDNRIHAIGSSSPTPVITGISPGSGEQGKTYSVTITGTGFETGKSTVSLSGSGVTIGSYSSRTDTQITCSFTIASDAATGMRTVTVTNPTSGKSAANTFTINPAPTIPVPTITTISPSSGQKGGTYTLTIIGKNFEADKSTISIPGGGITIKSYLSRKTEKIVCKIAISTSAKTGKRTLTVKNPTRGNTAIKTFTVSPGPAITKISPTKGQKGKTVSITITGKNFEAKKSTVLFSGTGLSVKSYPTRTANKIVCKVAISTTAKAGKRTLTVKNPTGGATASTSFTVSGPTITKISPVKGQKGKTVSLTITGSQFEAKKSTVTFSGTGISVKSYPTRTANKIVCKVAIASTTKTGKRTLTVKNPTGGGVATYTFTITAKSGTITDTGLTNEVFSIKSPKSGTSSIIKQDEISPSGGMFVPVIAPTMK